MGTTAWSGSSGGGLNPWIGWGISTLLLFFLNRNSDSGSSTSSQQPSKFTEDNVNCIGQPVPVVLGRCMVKNPLISYYGDFNAEPYTEEYGSWSGLSIWPAILDMLLSILSAIMTPDNVVTNTGTGYTVDSGMKRSAIVNAVANILLWLLLRLFNDHEAKTTIQKGFKYYLGWQHIICWTDDNIGIKRIWMNVYDSDVEASTQVGVWNNDDHVAWKQDNLQGIVAHIDDEEMFGGVDEGGGFVGDIHFYFGTSVQPFDAWMVEQMYQSASVPTELKGLTPKYPMFVTCVINNTSVYESQPTPPEPTPPEPTPPVTEVPTIVVIGSSLCVPYPQYNPNYSSWTVRFEEVSGYNVINKGIDGNTTGQMLERFWTDVISYHPNYCIMEVGIDDWQDVSVPYTLDATKAKVKTMINLCLMNDIEPIFLICLPPYNSMYGGGNYNIINNARIQQEALKNYIISLGYPVYPYEEALETSTGYIDLNLTFDNVHPNSQGNKLIGDKLYTYMNNLTKNDSYNYVAPKTAKVVVIGDSISAGSPYSDRPITIIAIGDSGTAGEPYTSVKPSDSADIYSWTHVIRDNMPNVTIHNMAISGERSVDMLARFDTDVVAHSPDYCLIGSGSNDVIGGASVATSINVSYTAIVEMFTKCVNANIKPVFVDYLFPNYDRISSLISNPVDIQYRIDFYSGLRTVVKQYCDLNGYGYIDLNPVFISGDIVNGSFDFSLISYDGVHPNTDGYDKGGRVALGAMRSYIDNASWVATFRDLTGYEVINQAVPSTTSEDSEQRFMQDVVDLKPDYCIFEHGNDVGWGMNQFYKTENAIQSVVQMCVNNDIKLIFVQPVLRYNMTAYAMATSTIIEDDIDYMHKMHEFETDLGYPSLVGYYTAISNDASEVNVDMNRLADNVHPNLQGYEDVGRWLTPQILLAMSEKGTPTPTPTPTPPVVANEVAGGAYIGKQATIPEMWFEVVNYPSRLADGYKPQIVQKFTDAINFEYQKPVKFIAGQYQTVQDYMKPYMEDLDDSLQSYQDAAMRYISDPNNNPVPSQSLLDSIYNRAIDAYYAYPPTNRVNFGTTLSGLENLAKNGIWHLGRLDDDLNPAEAIYEILMNKYWGCGYVEDRIDVNSLISLGAVCEQEKLGVSCLINRTARANDYVTKILNHINGVKYDDPKTGKLTFKLIRNDYDVDKIKSFDVSNTESCEFSRLDWSETTSAVEVSFTDASNKYDTGQFTFTDISNRLITGFYTSKSVEGDYFTTTANAKWLAQMNQLANGYPLSAVNLVTNRYAYDVTIGDPIKISWEPYGLTQVVYRVTDIDYATLTDGKISITGIEDVFGFDKLDFDVSESPQWTDPTEVPTEISRYMFMEDAYEMSHSLDTYVYAYAAKPSSDVVYWDVWRNVGGNYVKSSQSMMWSMMGRLTYGYLKDFDIDANGFEFSSLGSGGTDLIDDKIEKINTYPTTYTNTSGLNILIVDNEIMSYGSIEKLPNGHYQVKDIIRGIFDTLPEQHTAESIVYFVENRQNVAGAIKTVSTEGQSPVTEQLELRTETRNVAQPFDPTKIRSLTTTRRAEQPSVMANMKFGANMGTETVYEYDYTNDTIFSGDLLFTFLGRNKFDNYGIISQLDTTAIINVPTDVKNTIHTYSSNIKGEWKTDAYDSTTYTNINNATLTWAQFCEVMGDSLKDANSVLLDVLTYNETKQLYSYDKYEKTINWKVPRFVGVVSDANEAQTLADSYINVTDNVILVPQTTVSPAISLITTECPILIEGTLVTGTSSVNDIKCQDGNMYRLNNKAYRIVGWDSNNKAILYPFDITEYYVIRSDFTELINNYPVYYKYNGVNYDEVTISTDI